MRDDACSYQWHHHRMHQGSLDTYRRDTRRRQSPFSCGRILCISIYKSHFGRRAFQVMRPLGIIQEVSLKKSEDTPCQVVLQLLIKVNDYYKYSGQYYNYCYIGLFHYYAYFRIRVSKMSSQIGKLTVTLRRSEVQPRLLLFRSCDVVGLVVDVMHLDFEVVANSTITTARDVFIPLGTPWI